MNSIKNAMFTLALAVFMITGGMAQDLYQKGTIHLSKKKSMEAYIQIDWSYPQRFQTSLTYVTPKDYRKAIKKGKIKGKIKEKIQPKDLIGFEVEDGRRFEVVKYVDMTSGKMQKMLPKKLILQKVADGPIEVFKFYARTTGKISKELADMAMDAHTDVEARKVLHQWIQDNFEMLVRKDSKNPRNVVYINLLNYIGDNYDVKDKYDANHYGLRNQFSEEKKFGKYVNQEFEAALLRMVDDYNSQQLAK